MLEILSAQNPEPTSNQQSRATHSNPCDIFISYTKVSLLTMILTVFGTVEMFTFLLNMSHQSRLVSCSTMCKALYATRFSLHNMRVSEVAIFGINYRKPVLHENNKFCIYYLSGTVMHLNNRTIQLTQCCTQFKSPGVNILFVLYLNYL